MRIITELPAQADVVIVGGWHRRGGHGFFLTDPVASRC